MLSGVRFFFLFFFWSQSGALAGEGTVPAECRQGAAGGITVFALEPRAALKNKNEKQDSLESEEK